MDSVREEPFTNVVSEWSTNRTCQQDEDEIAKRIEQFIYEAKASISDKLEKAEASAERLLKHGRYAAEDGLMELTHQIKRYPIGFLGIAFAVGTVFGLLLSHASESDRGVDTAQ